MITSTSPVGSVNWLPLHTPSHLHVVLLVALLAVSLVVKVIGGPTSH